MNSKELVQLAERCEAATESDYDLDHQIFVAHGTHVFERRGRDKKEWWYPANGADYMRTDRVPRYTASLDAAITLVPEGWGRCIEQERATRSCEASLSPPGDEPWGPRAVNAEGETLALALCAASLRARAAIKQGDA